MSLGSIGRIALPAIGGVIGGIATAALVDHLALGPKSAAGVTGTIGAIGIVSGMVGKNNSVTALGAGMIGGALLYGLIAQPAKQGFENLDPEKLPPGTPVPPVTPTPIDDPGVPLTGPVTTGKVMKSEFVADYPVPTSLSTYTPQRGDLLPDGAQWRPKDLYIEQNGDRRVLRFDSKVANVGTGALQLALHNIEGNGTRTTQVIFSGNNGAREVGMDGEFIKDQHPEHNHLHFDDFEKYELFRQNPDGTIGEKVGENHKASFYITNIERVSKNPPRSGAVDFSRIQATTQQGISVGWADVYGAGLEGQEIDVTDLNPGNYVLRQIFDPSNRIAETDETNNTRDTYLQLR